MNLKHFVLLTEGINDKGIFKAIFMAGSPGSGKSYIRKKISSGAIDAKIVNTDKYTEFLGMNVPWLSVKDKIKKLTINEFVLYINGMLPLWIDGTSSSLSKVAKRNGILQSLGYDTALLFVNTNLETALERASKRKRVVSPDFLKQAYANIKKNKKNLISLFTKHFEVQNNEGELTDQVILKAFKIAESFFLTPIQNPYGKEIVNHLKTDKEKYLIPTEYNTLKSIKQKLSGWY